MSQNNEKKVQLYYWPTDNFVRPICPSGTGIIPIYSTKRDEKTGFIIREKTGETNLQEQMNKEAKTINLSSLFEELKQGKLKPVGVNYIDETKTPKDLLSSRANINKMLNNWDNNLLLKTMYPVKEDLKKDILNNVDITKKMTDFVTKMQSSIGAFNSTQNVDKKVVTEGVDNKVDSKIVEK